MMWQNQQLISYSKQSIFLITKLQNLFPSKIKIMNYRRKSLSPAELRYFRIGPKVLDPEDVVLRHKIDDAIESKFGNTSTFKSNPSLITLNKLNKTSYGNFQKTVRNFNILHNKHLGVDSVEHQVQKFGERVRALTQKMVTDRKLGDRATSKQQQLRDKIKEISQDKRQVHAESYKNGMKVKVVLKSFQLKSASSQNSEILPLAYLKILVQHVNSFRLISVIQPSLRIDGNQLTVEFERILSRISDYHNREQRYDQQWIQFQGLGQQLKLRVPILQIISQQTKMKQVTMIDNKDIMNIVTTNFQNVDEIVDKYFIQEQMKPFEQ